jgi:hypothetical protein
VSTSFTENKVISGSRPDVLSTQAAGHYGDAAIFASGNQINLHYKRHRQSDARVEASNTNFILGGYPGLDTGIANLR